MSSDENIDSISKKLEVACDEKLQKAFDKVTDRVILKYLKAIARKGRENCHIDQFQDDLYSHLKKAFNDIYVASVEKYGRGSSKAQTISFYSYDLQFTNQWKGAFKKFRDIDFQYSIDDKKFRALRDDYLDKKGIFAKPNLKVKSKAVKSDELSIER